MAKECPSYSTVKSWVADVRRVRTSTEDEERPERPCTTVTVENVDSIHDMILADRRIGLHCVVDTLGNNLEWVHYIMYDKLSMRELSPKLIPKILYGEKRKQKDCAKALLDHFSISASTPWPLCQFVVNFFCSRVLEEGVLVDGCLLNFGNSHILHCHGHFRPVEKNYYQ